MTRILTPDLLFDGKDLREGIAVTIDGDRITSVTRADPAGAERIPGILAPGFVDLQVNGGGGLMVGADSDAAALAHIWAAHRGLGCAGVLPTLIT
ncbi:MAG: N-acetylglucosamine-6-phosphate deacetylase, partial [Paracoccus sp. (in: a-proteobacteria)]|nr:N-acetylglucosamine-6-phosphate deacetylase [Paracoccus sp. (in: a-proteobacteria)]